MWNKLLDWVDFQYCLRFFRCSIIKSVWKKLLWYIALSMKLSFKDVLFLLVHFCLDTKTNQKSQEKIIAIHTKLSQQARFFLPYALIFNDL